MRYAGMMELVDMRDLGSREAIRVGSSPTTRTMLSQHYRCRRRNAYGINRFRDFSSQNFTENSIDAKALFSRLVGLEPLLPRRRHKYKQAAPFLNTAVSKRALLFSEQNIQRFQASICWS